jgi:hypothetical protein
LDPRLVLEAGLLESRVDRVCRPRPQARIGVHERRAFGFAQLEAVIAEIDQRPFGSAEELAAKLFVGDQPTNKNLDDPLRHVHRLSGEGPWQVAHPAVAEPGLWPETADRSILT